MMFLSWAVTTLRTMRATLRSQMEKDTTKRTIWNMTKQELIDVAVDELGISGPEASRETVTVLREKIRQRRRQVTETIDPRMMLPKGLEKMKHSELVHEALSRGLSPEVRDPKTGQQGFMTRAQIIILIRDAVDLLNISDWTMTDTATTTHLQSSAGAEEDL